MEFFCRSIASLAFVFSSPTFSQDTENNLEPFWSSSGNWVVSFGAGVQYPQWNDLMRVNNTPNPLTPRSNNLFSTRNQSEPVIGMALGRRWQHDSVWFPAYSFNAVWKYFSERILEIQFCTTQAQNLLIINMIGI